MTNIATSPTIDQPAGRQIRLWGSVARAAVGSGLLASTVVIGADRVDVLVGLVVFPLVEVAVLAVRGRNASPVRQRHAESSRHRSATLPISVAHPWTMRRSVCQNR